MCAEGPTNMPIAILSLVLFAAAGGELNAAPAGGSTADADIAAPNDPAEAPSSPDPATTSADTGEEAIGVAPGEGPATRQHRSSQPERRGTHELRDPADWPSEPDAPADPLDEARFDAAVVALCDEVAPSDGLDAVARLVREVSAETKSDPFLMAALVYRQSRCRPGLESVGGVGLLQIEPSMFGPRATLPVAREDLARDRLRDPRHNLQVGAALLAMWQATHVAVDAAAGSTPHRTAVAHLVWGDHVWGATAEDRVLVARRRLLQLYTGLEELDAVSYPGLAIVPPLTGGVRLGVSGPGADREGGKREHRGIDIDASVGEPVRAVADGVVQFAGADMPGRLAARDLVPRQLHRWRSRRMGPGGFFVRIVHDDGVRTGYFHLHTYNVVAGQSVKAGEVIGRVGLTGVKTSASHLHFEVHQDGELGDPVRFLQAYVLSPERTISHTLAMAVKRERLARVRARHARRHPHRVT
jgi:murein DD-endopeptidase MepM/ murein hydrolase activator NlpD